MSFFFAPTAFLNPISLVLSVTETSMIFMIPMPPTNKLMPATPPRKTVKTPVIVEAISKNISCDMIEKSSSASLSLCLSRRIRETSSSAALTTSEVIAET